ncbi:MAG: CvfD/Ygs/GSP13 family RNA-binding post-transcriptional regulator [Bacilli bacterium]|nr:CvfD/Ygs/GSP13 family RNA-binding post-transcriptional regulator [Bacilli bacterium]
MIKLQTGEVVMGSVTGIKSYGIFVNIDENYNGLIHISEISDDFIRNINDYVNIGETINVRIIGIDGKTNKLKLSIRDLDYKIDKSDREEIIETKHGFNTLEKNLPEWINIKKIEMDNY